MTIVTDTAAMDPTANDVILELLARCSTRNIFTMAEIGEAAMLIPLDGTPRVPLDKFLDAHKDDEYVGAGRVADMLLDTLIAIDALVTT